MHPANHDPAFAAHDRSQCIRAPHHVALGAQGLVILRVARPDGRRKDDQICVADVRCVLAEMKLQAETLQPPDLDGAHFIGAADLVAQREEQAADAAHPRTGDADEVNLQRSCDEDFRENLSGIHVANLLPAPLANAHPKTPGNRE